MTTIETLYQHFLACSGVTTDSRNCPADSLFIALKGASFNGNAFAAKALEQGCRYAVIDEPAYQLEGDERYLLVEDGLTALQQLAHYHRQQFQIPVIAITGTNGKTTTKELVAAVLSSRRPILYTQLVETGIVPLSSTPRVTSTMPSVCLSPYSALQAPTNWPS